MKKYLLFIIFPVLETIHTFAQTTALPDPFGDIQYGIKTSKSDLWNKQTGRWQPFGATNQDLLADCRVQLSTEYTANALGAFVDSVQTDVFYRNGRLSRTVTKGWDATLGDWKGRRQTIFNYPTTDAKIPVDVVETVWRDDLNMFYYLSNAIYTHQNGRLVQFRRQTWTPQLLFTDTQRDTFGYNAAGKLAFWKSMVSEDTAVSFKLQHHYTYIYDNATGLLMTEILRDTNALNGGFQEQNIVYTYDNRKNIASKRWEEKQTDGTWRDAQLEVFADYNVKNRPLSKTTSIRNGIVGTGLGLFLKHLYIYEKDTVLTELVAQVPENRAWENIGRLQLTHCYAPTTGSDDRAKPVLKLTLWPNPATDLVKIDADTEGGIFEMSVFNTMGQLVKTEKQFDVQKTLIVNDLPNGYYILKLSNTRGFATQRLIIAR